MVSNTSSTGHSPDEAQAPNAWAAKCVEILRLYFRVYRVVSHSERIVEVYVEGPLEPVSWERALKLAYKATIDNGCYMRLLKRREAPSILLVKPEGGRRNRALVNLTLLLITLGTVYLSGLAFAGEKYGSGFAWSPVGYLTALLVPLLLHETGHWTALRRYKTPASLPYLIPAPPLQLGFIGTFGAIIDMRWLPPDNIALATVGIAGPITGFIAALPFAFYGVKHSVVLPLGSEAGTLPVVPLILALLPAPRSVGPHEALVMSPMAFASYVVFLVTFLNLLPIATLDGGHIVRALLGYRIHYAVSVAVTLALFAASYKWPVFTLFALLALLILYLNRLGHPGTATGVEKYDFRLAIIGVLYAALLILTLPVPVS